MNVCVIGGGAAGMLAALTAACYLVQDGQMEGSRVHIL